jgi:beta-xylosidase
MKYLFIIPIIIFSLSGCMDDNPGNHDGSPIYTNPLYCADYPDPDVIKVGNDFYMVNSSFTYSPGLPIYHSKDLVHWQLIANIVDRRDESFFDVPQHGNGIWAPTIRFHKDYFYVYFGDPDFGIYMSRAQSSEGPWMPPTPVVEGKGLIDPCPFWDDDGNAYLVHAWAKSRAGFNSILTIHRMHPDGTRLLGEIEDGVTVFDGTETQPTIEGPKMYKRNGYYYIFAPAGGVRPGWQTVLRSENVFGPYEDRIVMHQGSTDINGPHQGAWVALDSGEHWFIHFQDRLAYGRVLHLNPMEWLDDGWPIVGIDKTGDGIGEPVGKFRYPYTGNEINYIRQLTSDEFDSARLGIQWRWHANHRDDWYSLTKNPGFLRLNSLPVDDINLWNVAQVVTQRFPAEEFKVTAKLHLTGLMDGDITGIAATGSNYATLRIKQHESKRSVSYMVRNFANEGGMIEVVKERDLKANIVYLRMEITREAVCSFSFSNDGESFERMGSGFEAQELRWVGAGIGLYSISEYDRSAGLGYTDIEWVRFDYEENNM